MGQKVNPVGFRLGYNHGWKSISYSSNADYAKHLSEDLKIREFVKKEIASAGVVDVIIKRQMNNLIVEISVARPGIVIGKGGAGIDKLKKALSRITKSRLDIKLFEVKSPDASARLIGQSIASQVSRRIVPKFAAQREIEKAKAVKGVKGIRIWISGRIKGAEIARTEKFQWGSVPLQTLKAKIDYAYEFIGVPNAGIHGIKVWVYSDSNN